MNAGLKFPFRQQWKFNGWKVFKRGLDSSGLSFVDSAYIGAFL